MYYLNNFRVYKSFCCVLFPKSSSQCHELGIFNPADFPIPSYSHINSGVENLSMYMYKITFLFHILSEM